MNVNQLATRAGINPSTVRSVLKERCKSPKAETVYYICLGLGISMDEFYNSEELASGDEALEAFNKIKLEAALTNLVNQIDYELGIPWIDNGRVCNTATNYWGLEYIPLAMSYNNILAYSNLVI